MLKAKQLFSLVRKILLTFEGYSLKAALATILFFLDVLWITKVYSAIKWMRYLVDHAAAYRQKSGK